MSDEPGAACPECGRASERLISGGSGFLFKGDGFYITDYRSEAYRKRVMEEAGVGAEKESAGSSKEAGAGSAKEAGAASSKSASSKSASPDTRGSASAGNSEKKPSRASTERAAGGDG